MRFLAGLAHGTWPVVSQESWPTSVVGWLSPVLFFVKSLVGAAPKRPVVMKFDR